METDPEWDDDSRQQTLALRAYERSVCGCGFPKSWTRDKSRHFTFEDDKCPVCAAAERYSRVQHDADEKHRKTLGEHPPANRDDPGDGRRTFIRLMSADEIEHHQQQKGARRGNT